MDLNQALGRALRHVRKKKGLTQEDFEPITSRSYISKVEGGYHLPTLDKTVEICDRMGVSPSLLLSLTFLIANESEDVSGLLDRLKGELDAIGIPRK
ncbi:helix-turn-helix domain-containing protein [Pseudomonas izuensis]|uniref:helix-turn-helix domain-containing protein n=1 Tax=Pseudomonas izuensis TaxID=2684212 RepID=UPI00080C0F18